MNEFARGSIFAEEAYAQGKMLDHSSWQSPCAGGRPLPRRVTASDADMTFAGDGEIWTVPFLFDNNDSILFCELSSHARQWSEIMTGQSRLYSALVKTAPHCAVLCHHNVKPEHLRKIDTRYDIDSFQIRLFDYGIIDLPPCADNNKWQAFVLGWFDNPLMMRRKIIAKHVRLVSAAQPSAMGGAA